MAFHGRCIVLDTHALFLYVHQFSFTCHGAGSMEKGRERGVGWGLEGRRETNSAPQESLQGRGWELHLAASISQQREAFW